MPSAIFDRALKLLEEQLERKKLAATSRPRIRGGSAEASKADRGETNPSVTGTGFTPAGSAPRPANDNNRYIPAQVKRTVWARDGGQCAFTSEDGRRCTERGRLEFRHVEPFAVGGQATTENISLRCRAHNGHDAEVRFGRSCRPAARQGESGGGKKTQNRTFVSGLGPDGVREAHPTWTIT